MQGRCTVQRDQSSGSRIRISISVRSTTVLFTVFAPTNAAFEKLPEGTVDNLLLPENKDQLTNVLTYHVVPGRYTAADLMDGMTLTTVQGQTLTITMQDGTVMVNGEAMVETADVISSNGVTHVIDTVLLPQ